MDPGKISTDTTVENPKKTKKLSDILHLLSVIIKYALTPCHMFNDFIHSSRLYCYLDQHSPRCLVTIKILIWLSFWSLSILAEFGLVFLVASAILFMFLNTSTRKKLDGEPSAYSVFNKNCERIKGTLTAEDLEKQLVYGSLF